MLKQTQMGIKLELAQIEKAYELMKKLHTKMQEYNKTVEKSNRLLREQEKLREKLGIKVIKGKTIGLVKDNKNDLSDTERKKTD